MALVSSMQAKNIIWKCNSITVDLVIGRFYHTTYSLCSSIKTRANTINSDLFKDLKVHNPTEITSVQNKQGLENRNKRDIVKFKGVRQYSNGQNITIPKSNTTFKDFRNVLTVTKQGEEETDFYSDEFINDSEVTDIEIVVKKAEHILRDSTGIDFRRKPSQEMLFRTLVTQQLDNHNLWIKAVWKRPELLKYNHSAEDLLGLIDFAVSGLQLSRKKAFALLHVIPHELIKLLHNNETYTTKYATHDQSSVDVTTTLINWQAFCEKYDLDSINTLSDAPEVLYIPPQLWQDRVSELSEYFVIRRHLPDLIKNNAAAVLLEGYPSLKRKIDYFVKTMHVDVQDISKCKAFTVNLDLIKKRFLFLEKSGLYRHPVPNDVGSSKSAKPAFYKIVETPPNQFFEKVVFPAGGKGLTQGEYDAFVRGLTPDDLSENRYEDPNKTGYEDLANALEEESWYADEGYHMPSLREDIEENSEHRKGYK